jgi:Ca-activated chloride channel homolog
LFLFNLLGYLYLIMQLANPAALYWLLLVPLFIGIFWFHKKWYSNAIIKLGNEKLVPQLIVNNKIKNFQLLVVLSFLLLILAITGLRVGSSEQKVKSSNATTFFCLDVSNSMNATDIAPTRLDRAKLLINKIIQTNALQKFGLIVFAGNAYIVSPATTDHGMISMQLSALSSSSVPTQGTNINAALKTALNCFNSKELSSKRIILISDGEHHEEGISSTINEINNQGIKVGVVAVGTAEGIAIADNNTAPVFNEDGNQVISKLNTQLLESIALDTKGIFTNASQFVQAEDDLNGFINQTTNKDLGFTTIKDYNYYYQWFLLPAIIIFIILIYKKRAKLALPLIGVVLVFLFSNEGKAQAFKKNITSANRLYIEKKFDTAARAYNSITRNKGYNKIDIAKAFYNLGNAYAKQQDWQAAINNYKESLLLEPTSTDAKYNLVYAQKKLQQEQKKNNQQQDSQQKNSKDDKKDSDKTKQDSSKSNQQNNQDKKPPPSPQQSKSKLTPEQAKQLLQALKQEEQKLIKNKLKGNVPTNNNTRKNW